MEEADVRDTVLFYCRKGVLHAMLEAASGGAERFPHEPSFRLYAALALALGGRTAEATAQLETLLAERALAPAPAVGLLLLARRQASIGGSRTGGGAPETDCGYDAEAVTRLEARVREERRRAGEYGLLHTATLLYLAGCWEKAREYADKLLKVAPKSAGGLALKGWIGLALHPSSAGKDTLKYFDAAIEQSPGKKNIDATLGKAQYYKVQKDHQKAIGLLNQAIVRIPSYVPPLLEKAENQLALLEWDQTSETLNRILSHNPEVMDARILKAVVIVCRNGNCQDGSTFLQKLYSDMCENEPKNAMIFLGCAQLFSRVCGRNPLILTETFKYAEKAVQIKNSDAEIATELGYQYLLQGRVSDAAKVYRKASKLDESSVAALAGITKCQLESAGNKDQVIQQVEFLREVQGNTVSPEVFFMSAKLASGDSKKALAYLDDATGRHLQFLKDLSYGTSYLKLLDPDFLIQIVREYLTYVPVESLTSTITNFRLTPGVALSATLEKCHTILKIITKACPGLLEGVYYLARVQFLSEDHKGAINSLKHILDDLDAAHVDSNVLMALIHIHQGSHQKAAQVLEVGLSYNFQVREHPLYHLITALVLKNQGNINECIHTLQTAMSMSSLKSRPEENSYRSSHGCLELSLRDKATIYLELAEAYRESNLLDEAAATISNATKLFVKTSEESRVIIANADLSVSRGDTKEALHLLRSITPDQTYYKQACYKMADIHLNHRKDRRAFAQCFRDLVENAPGPQSYVMLGDAYISIHEPDRAIEVYEQALKRNPKDSVLTCKMGKALIKTHQYGKAVNYYLEAIKNDESIEIKLDLAELYMKLGQFENAEKTVALELENRIDNGDTQMLVSRTRVLMLLVQIQEKSGNTQAAFNTLQETYNNQARLVKRASLDSYNDKEQTDIAAKICRKIAEYATVLRNYESAIHFHNEALTYDTDDSHTLMALAQLYLQVNNLEQCQRACASVLQTDADNEAACLMLADLAFRKVDLTRVAFHLDQLLGRSPAHWAALARLEDALRRMGNLEGIPVYLAKGELACRQSHREAGLSYCRGLFEWYTGNVREAFRLFSGIRHDHEWGKQATYNMLEICINIDDLLGCDLFPDVGTSVQSKHETALPMAEKLMKEIKSHSQGSDEVLRFKILQRFILLASKQKANIDRALEELAILANEEPNKDNVCLALAVGTACVMSNQLSRARHQLKRYAKSAWSFEDAVYLERCWLLLAILYVHGGKNDMAAELLNRVLQHNKSCAKAYEFAGLVAEREQLHREAAAQLECAWRFGGCANVAIGYRLAFNYMKERRHADAVRVCQHILALEPDFPKIRKDILEKCRNNLRT